MNIVDSQLRQFLFVDLIPVALIAAGGFLTLKYIEYKHGTATGEFYNVMCSRLYNNFLKEYDKVGVNTTPSQFAASQNNALNNAYTQFTQIGCPEVNKGVSINSYRVGGQGGHTDCTSYGNQIFSQSMLNCGIMQNLDPTKPKELVVIQQAQTLWNQLLTKTYPGPTIQWPYTPGTSNNCQCVLPPSLDNNGNWSETQACCWLHANIGGMVEAATGKYPACPMECQNKNTSGIYCMTGQCTPQYAEQNCNLYGS